MPLVVPQLAGRSVFDGSVQANTVGAPRWFFTIESGPLTAALVPQWEALADRLREATGQAFIVDAKQGALGSVAASFVARAPAAYRSMLETAELVGERVHVERERERELGREVAPEELVALLDVARRGERAAGERLEHHVSRETGPLAESVESSGGVFLVPAFAGLGSPYWDPYARGTIVGLTRGSGRSHITRAVLEGIAHRGVDLVEAAEADAGIRIERLRVDGEIGRAHV